MSFLSNTENVRKILFSHIRHNTSAYECADNSANLDEQF